MDNPKKTRWCCQMEKAPFSDSRAESSHWIGRLETGSQWGQIPGVMWLEEQSSEVLYDTYHHGLPFNQRVERKDKVKLRSPFERFMKLQRKLVGKIYTKTSLREGNQFHHQV